jgi:hypothetical protein
MVYFLGALGCYSVPVFLNIFFKKFGLKIAIPFGIVTFSFHAEPTLWRLD